MTEWVLIMAFSVTAPDGRTSVTEEWGPHYQTEIGCTLAAGYRNATYWLRRNMRTIPPEWTEHEEATCVLLLNFDKKKSPKAQP